MTRISLIGLAGVIVSACSSVDAPSENTASQTSAIGTLEVMVAMDNPPVSPDVVIEDLGGDFMWSEGPVWIQEGNYLLFTDVPGKTIHRYSDADGFSEWMSPSTRPGAEVTGQGGANGLLNYRPGRILVPDHGSRSLYILDLNTKDATLLTERFEGQRLNSPNDVVVHRSGAIFFTDPPYGLSGQDSDPAKELAQNNVYRLSPDGVLSVVDGALTRPNGIVLSPDQRTLIVANSDPEDSKYVAYDLDALGNTGEGRMFLDVVQDRRDSGFGNPDGMAVAKDGTVFATGPGGLLVVSAEGELLSRIRMDRPCANVTFGDADGQSLYVTCQDRLVRVRSNRTGLEF